MTDEGSSDRLARAIELSLQYESNPDSETVEDFLDLHDDLRELLEPLLAEEAPAADDDRRVLGDYELLRELGRGGMGVVYEAVQTLLGRSVALKLLPPHRALSARSVAMFRREATLAASLDHPGIARVFDYQEVDGQLALAMELVDGVPLDDVIDNLVEIRRQKGGANVLDAADLAAAAAVEEPVPEAWRGRYEDAAVDLCRQVAEALAHAHSRGIVHRDVKPGNVLVTPRGTAVLTDFGLAREEGVPGATRQGEFAGTYQYASPEQLEGDLDLIDARSDVYSLGATLYELLTLQRPLHADSLTELIVLIKREDPPPPSRANRRVSHDLDAVVLCALEKDPAKRYTAADELAVDLRHVLDGQPVKARRLSRPARLLRWIDRNRLAAALVAVLLVSLTSITFLASRWWSALARYRLSRVSAALNAIEPRAERAHPPWPGQRDELAELLRICEADLLGMRGPQEAALRSLRAGASSVAVRDAERGPHPAVARIAELRSVARRLELEKAAPGVAPAARAEAEAEIGAMRREIAGLEAVVAASDRVLIADRDDRALHDQLEAQLYRLRLLESTLREDLRFRLAFAERVERDSIVRHRAAWEAAAGRVAADPRFRGHRLTPQIGIVPLGPDPESGLEEFADLLSGAVPVREQGVLRLSLEHGIVLVLLPGGATQVTMRSERNDTSRKAAVRLDPFLLGKHEVSRAQWRRLAREVEGLRWRDGGLADVRNHGELDKPVNGVSFVMCQRLFERSGLELPTAAQWEYAAFFGGGVPNTPEALARVANLRDRAYAAARGKLLGEPVPMNDGHVGLTSITAMAPTPGGLFHLYGNVSEFCRDLFASYDLGSPPRDGDGLRQAEADPGATRMQFGGNWQGVDPVLMFNRWAPTNADRDTGVRAARRLHEAGAW